MIDTTLLKHGVLVIGLLLSVNGYAQVVTEFLDWEEFSGDDINQGPDGPCEYITRTWAVEYAVRMSHKKPGYSDFSVQYVDLSEHHIYQSCLQDVLYRDGKYCYEQDGITPSCMIDFLENYGIANDTCFPPLDNVPSYEPIYQRDVIPREEVARCENPCINKDPSYNFRVRVHFDVGRLASDLDINGSEELKKSIIKYGPHSVYFQGGQYVSGEHAILITGWDSAGNWRIKNSSNDYFLGAGLHGIESIAFDIGDERAYRVNGIPECVGSGCTNRFTRRALDSDSDGFCSIKWGDIPSGLGCKGHDADDDDSEIGPYNAYGYKTRLMSGSTVTLGRSRVQLMLPVLVRAKARVILEPGFKCDAQDGGRNFTAFVGDSF